MQITGMLIFLGAWLLLFWIGSIALEATGLERTKARFQALSALTGAGFTTTESESIVNHRQRRIIVAWMIFLGSVGIVAFFFVLILYLRAGFRAPSIGHIAAILGSLVFLGLIIAFGILDKITSGIIRLFGKNRPTAESAPENIIYQTGDYAVSRIKIPEKASEATLRVEDLGLARRGVTVLAIEGNDRALFRPGGEDTVMPGDRLLCYGRISDITALADVTR